MLPAPIVQIPRAHIPIPIHAPKVQIPTVQEVLPLPVGCHFLEFDGTEQFKDDLAKGEDFVMNVQIPIRASRTKHKISLHFEKVFMIFQLKRKLLYIIFYLIFLEN